MSEEQDKFEKRRKEAAKRKKKLQKMQNSKVKPGTKRALGIAGGSNPGHFAGSCDCRCQCRFYQTDGYGYGSGRAEGKLRGIQLLLCTAGSEYL